MATARLPVVLTASCYSILTAISPVTHAADLTYPPGDLTGDDLLKFCVTRDPMAKPPANRDESDQIIRCLGYFEGTVTTMLALNGAGFCLPENVRPADILVNSVNWLEAHPDQKHYLAASDIVAATQAKWPCR